MPDSLQRQQEAMLRQMELKLTELDVSLSRLGEWYRQQEGRLDALERFHMLEPSRQVAQKDQWRKEHRSHQPCRTKTSSPSTSSAQSEPKTVTDTKSSSSPTPQNASSSNG